MYPYNSLPAHAFWKEGVSNRSAIEITDIWNPKFPIAPADRIATYGSCFAQHIGEALDKRGYNWFRAEAEIYGMSKPNLKKFGYNLFSSRTGNIYTTSQMLQWTEWAKAPSKMPKEVWNRNGRFYDVIRPTLEPEGFASLEELYTARKITCAAFEKSVKRSQVFIFTLGLTERWLNNKLDFEYTLCPPPKEYDEDNHIFSSMSYGQVEDSLQQSIDNLRAMNPALKVILTVSPVPLVATASGSHVLVATTHSKSLLRTVAGQASQKNDFVDYFPSYEIINNPAGRGHFFDENLRTVNDLGVKNVMDSFFSAQETKFGQAPDKAKDGASPSNLSESQSNIDDLICEEEISYAFGAKE